MNQTLKNAVIINVVIFLILTFVSLQFPDISWEIWTFFYLVLFSSILEQNLEPLCKHPTLGLSIYSVLHHILTIYLTFGGFLFGYNKTHMTILLIVLLSWILWESRCVAHIYYNTVCELDKNRPFHDITRIIFNDIGGIGGTDSRVYKWPILGSSFAYDFYSIAKGL
jgi:hypothetical protein